MKEQVIENLVQTGENSKAEGHTQRKNVQQGSDCLSGRTTRRILDLEGRIWKVCTMEKFREVESRTSKKMPPTQLR